jgi:hypothetical protein
VTDDSDQFSPLMSCTIADPGQVSNVGTTRPTPLPLRVGAKQKRDQAWYHGMPARASGR